MGDCQLNSAQRVDFKAKQREFVAYIKDPFHNPIPVDVNPQRMDTYRSLMFNNVSGFLNSNFPVLKEILTTEQWFELAQDFFARHPCESPYFTDIPEEFIAYLQQERDREDDYPFMLELAHYEWVEMALSIAKETLPVFMQPLANLLQQPISLSPLAWSLAYQYPVQKISPDFLPLTPPKQASYLIVYRDWDDEVHFIQTTLVTFRLLELLQAKPEGLVENYLQQIATEMKVLDSDVLINQGLKIIQNLIQKGIVFNSHPA
jgi:hypothetical protein